MPRRVALPPDLHGRPFTTRTASERGVGEGRLRGADLARPFHGIRSPVLETSFSLRLEALHLRMPPDAFFCTLTAARIQGLPLPVWASRSPALHVGVPSPGRACRAVGTVGHKLQLDPDDVCDWAGLRVTTPARTWCDLAVVLDLPNLVAAGDRVIFHEHPLADLAELEAAVLRHRGRRGRARLLEGLPLLSGRAESHPESIIRVAIVRAGIEGLVANHSIYDARGTFIARADLCFPAHRVIFEYQGEYHRTEPDRWRKDRTRIARLAAAGWFVIEIAAGELSDQRMLLQLIRDSLALHPASFTLPA